MRNVFFAILCLGLLGCASLDRSSYILSVLTSINQDEKLKSAVDGKETSSFIRLKSYIKKDMLKLGLKSSFVSKRFGEPVVILPNDSGKIWAYKPSYASWFEEEKIYLFFDADDNLTHWELKESQDT